MGKAAWDGKEAWQRWRVSQLLYYEQGAFRRSSGVGAPVAAMLSPMESIVGVRGGWSAQLKTELHAIPSFELKKVRGKWSNGTEWVLFSTRGRSRGGSVVWDWLSRRMSSSWSLHVHTARRGLSCRRATRSEIRWILEKLRKRGVGSR